MKQKRNDRISTLTCIYSYILKEKVFNNIKKGTLVILQSNNYFEIKDHVNCFNTLQEFEASVNFDKILYKGQLELPKYTRFMVIGVR